jgi:excisionase family DNA binding protein
MSQTDPQDELLTVREVACELRVTVKTVYRLLSDEQLPSVRIATSGHYRVRRGDLDAWLRQRKR